MNDKTYVSQEKVDLFLSFLKSKELWGYYLIVYNLIHSQKTYVELQKGGLDNIIIPEGIPIPNKNPFLINICGVNTQLKIYQKQCGIMGVNFSTRLFKRKFSMGGEIFYGAVPQERNKNRKIDEGYVYIIKHVHRNPEVCKLLTDKKIGITYDIDKRSKQLTLGTVGVEIVKLWKSSSDIVQFFEKEIHSRLRDRNLIGEWFSDEDNSLIGIVEGIINENSLIKVV
jgi:hypothetical protein